MRNKNILFIHLEKQYAKTDSKNEIYAKNWVRRTWTEKSQPREKSTVNGQSKSTVKLKVNGQIQNQKMTSADGASSDVSKLLGPTSAMMLAKQLTHVRRVTAGEGSWRARAGVCGRVWRMIGGTATLSGAWGRVRSLMTTRLPQVCRSAQDDLSGTFKNVIGAILATVMQRVVVCAV